MKTRRHPKLRAVIGEKKKKKAIARENMQFLDIAHYFIAIGGCT